MNELFLELGHVSINKHDETLCGDFYYKVEDRDKLTVVLSDGLGSGVKANILATLTSKILSTMVSRNMPLDDCIDTMASTLPVCKERKLAYATFTVLEVEDDQAHLVQYDNPRAILLRNGKRAKYADSVRFSGEKEIHESRIPLQVGDILVMMSDGVANAGVGKLMPDGFSADDVAQFLETWYTPDISAARLAAALASACQSLSLESVDDDTTVIAVRVRERRVANMIVGPPENRDDDDRILKLFFRKEGRHIVCGGTTAKTVSRYLDKPIEAVVDSGTDEIPAIASIEGVDLVTEGVITVQKLVEMAEDYAENNMVSLSFKDKTDGASLLAEMLFEEATDVNIFFGTAVNHAHDDMEIDFDTKHALMKRLEAALMKMGKRVKISLC